MKNKICIFAFILFLVALIGGVHSKLSKEVSVQAQIPEQIFIPDKLDSWLDKLEKGENCNPRGTMDNGSLSYGAFCYKAGTFVMFVRKFKFLKNTEDAELMNFIGDPDFQRTLTRKEFLEDPNAWKHWRTTIVYKIGFPPLNETPANL